jgi:hypothetical protein
MLISLRKYLMKLKSEEDVRRYIKEDFFMEDPSNKRTSWVDFITSKQIKEKTF